MEENLYVSVSPHVFSKRTTQNIMLDVIIALCPAAIASVIIFGARSIAVIATCIICCVGFEALFNIIIKKKQTIADLSAVVTGLLLALNLPVNIPIWQAVVGSFAAIIIVKALFGGLGYNFANPAITGRIIMLIAFTDTMTAAAMPTIVDSVASATPLANLAAGEEVGASLFDMFLGLRGGALGETCVLALLIGGIYLIARKVITWHCPVAFIGTVFILSLIYTGSLEMALMYLFSGGVFIGAFFMATDYVTSPTTPKGQLIFGLGCGLITCLIRFWGSYPEGVSFSILLMNILCPYIEKLTMNKPSTISFQPEGTNTAGDLGAAASLTYTNRNLFKGSELFSLELRGAFEAITGLEGYKDQDYQEYSIESKLAFPRFLAPFLSKSFVRKSQAISELSLGWNLQNRPEYQRRVFSAGWRYRWSDTHRNIAYRYDLIDLNYVYMPWISETFKNDYLDDETNRNAILRYNYEDLFIMKMGFGMNYNDARHVVKANVETAGNLLASLSRVSNFKKNDNGQYTLFDIAYAQYAKFDIDYSRYWKFDTYNELVAHVGVGVAYPYGNSTILPFEKRYFSGGANSVRGWSVRELGPGSFRGKDGRIDFINQTGDMKLDINVEYRTRLFWKFNGAFFVDAGNVWTLRNYEEQPGGQFKVDEFYKQIAVAYGVGLRLNFDYFILRADMGMKALNPAYDTRDEHYAMLHPDFSRDFFFYFAVGLPF